VTFDKTGVSQGKLSYDKALPSIGSKVTGGPGLWRGAAWWVLGQWEM